MSTPRTSRPAIQVRLNFALFNDMTLFVTDRANDCDGFSAQLPHRYRIPGHNHGERLLDGSLKILAPKGPFPGRGIDLDEVRELCVAIMLVVRSAVIKKPPRLHAIRRRGKATGFGAHRFSNRTGSLGPGDPLSPSTSGIIRRSLFSIFCTVAASVARPGKSVSARYQTPASSSQRLVTV